MEIEDEHQASPWCPKQPSNGQDCPVNPELQQHAQQFHANCRPDMEVEGQFPTNEETTSKHSSVENQPDGDHNRLSELDDFEGLANVYLRPDNH